MSDKPIIFSGPMVRALLDGRKTQPRRVLNPQPPVGAHYSGVHFATGEPDSWFFNSPQGPMKVRERYAAGDWLWVREAWRVGAWDWNNARVAIDYGDGPRQEWLAVEDGDMLHRLIDQSRADARKAGRPLRDSYYEYSWAPGESPCRWRPSIHMPRWASRLTLTVTEVRVQRLQDISDEDAAAEGCTNYGGFCAVWENLYGGPDAWDANPWVVALTFTVQRGNIDA